MNVPQVPQQPMNVPQVPQQPINVPQIPQQLINDTRDYLNKANVPESDYSMFTTLKTKYKIEIPPKAYYLGNLLSDIHSAYSYPLSRRPFSQIQLVRLVGT